MNSVINYATTFKPLLAGNKLALCKLLSLDRHPENQELNPVQESGRRRSLGTERRLCTSAPCSRRAALGLPAPPVSLELGSYVLAPKYWAKYWSLYSAGLSGRQDVLWFCVHRLKQDDFLELSFGKACEHREMCYDTSTLGQVLYIPYIPKAFSIWPSVWSTHRVTWHGRDCTFTLSILHPSASLSFS